MVTFFEVALATVLVTGLTTVFGGAFEAAFGAAFGASFATIFSSAVLVLLVDLERTGWTTAAASLAAAFLRATLVAAV